MNIRYTEVMKLSQPSFFGKLLSAFVLCSVAPLFLLAFVFTGVAEYAVKVSSRNRAEETVSSALAAVLGHIRGAQEMAVKISLLPETAAYCETAGGTEGCRGERESLLVSDILQTIRSYGMEERYRVFVLPERGRALFKKSLPEQYEEEAYRDWGIFNAVKDNAPYALFTQPHPGSGEDTAAAVIVPVYREGSGAVSGYVIVDILRESLFTAISQTEGLHAVLNSLIVYDSKLCIMYSHFPGEESYKEASFYVPVDYGIHAAGNEFGVAVYGREAEPEGFRYLRGIRPAALLLSVFTASAAFCVAFLFSKSLASPVQALAKAMRGAESGDLSYRCPEPAGNTGTSRELAFLIRRFNRMAERIQKSVHDTVEQERRLRIAEVKNLQAQINPHFLFNTLNSLKSMARLAGNEDIADMIVCLGRLLRYGVGREGDTVTLDAELEHIRSYFDIETYRWQGRFTLSENIEPRLHTYPIPRLVLQPLVENALLHGLERKAGQGNLCIRAFCDNENGCVRIWISDDGCGIAPRRLAEIQEALSRDDGNAAVDPNLGSNGIALINTHRRLQLLYGSRYGIGLCSEEGCGTSAEVCLPYRGYENGDPHDLRL